MGVLLLLAMLGFALFQLVLGYTGIEYHLGKGWAIAASISAIPFGFMLPVTIGSYFGAVDVLGWPWWAGVLIAAPGLAFAVPGAIFSIFSGWRRR